MFGGALGGARFFGAGGDIAGSLGPGVAAPRSRAGGRPGCRGQLRQCSRQCADADAPTPLSGGERRPGRMRKDAAGVSESSEAERQQYRVGNVPRQLSQIARALRDTCMSYETSNESTDVFVRARSQAEAIGLVAPRFDRSGAPRPAAARRVRRRALRRAVVPRASPRLRPRRARPRAVSGTALPRRGVHAVGHLGRVGTVRRLSGLRDAGERS